MKIVKPREHFLLVVLFLVALPAENAPAPERTLIFPSDRIVGTVQVRPVRVPGTFESLHDDWITLSDATGTVAIPAGHDVLLRVEGISASGMDTHPIDLRFLPKLPSTLERAFVNDIDLPTDPEWYDRIASIKTAQINTSVSDQHLAGIARLKNLEYLDLSNAAMSDRVVEHLLRCQN